MSLDAALLLSDPGALRDFALACRAESAATTPQKRARADRRRFSDQSYRRV